MANWDGADYIQIAIHGYVNNFWINWFPFYPITIWAANHIIPSALDSALTVTWLSLIGAIYFYLQIVRDLFKVKGIAEPLSAVTYFVLFPTAIFLIAPFSESLFSLLALGAIYACMKRRWLLAGVCGTLCTATHVTGIAVIVLIVLLLIQNKVSLQKALAAGAIACLGLMSYMSYLYASFGNPLGFMQSQQIFHHWTGNGYLNLITSISFTNAIFVILLVVAAIYWWRNYRNAAFSIYCLLFLLIPILGKQYGGFDRYVLVAYPLPLMLFDYFRRKPGLVPYVFAGLGASWLYTLLQYAGGYIGS